MTSQDVVMVFDSSASMEVAGFESTKNFSIDMIKRMDVGPTSTHVCVVEFSMKPFVVFNFTDYFSSDEVVSAIEALVYNEGATGKDLLAKYG